MNEINNGFMEKLLDGEKIERKTLGEVGQLIRGNGLQKKDFTETGIPAIHYGQIYTHYGNFTTKTKSFVSPELAKTLKKVDNGDVVITNTSENIEDVGKALAYFGGKQAVTGGHATIFKPSKEILSMYLVYYTHTPAFDKEKRKYAKGTKVIDVSATDMSKILIPIPPLRVQKEIVRILDTFTALTAELTAELTARKKQYNYYRDKLLNFNEKLGGGVKPPKVVTHTLGDVAKVLRGKRLTKGQLSNSDKFPVYHGGLEPLGYYNHSNRPANSVMIINVGASAGTVGYSFVDFWSSDGCYCIRPSNLLNSRFLYYTLIGFQHVLQSRVRVAGIPTLDQVVIESLKIPIPPLPEQARIVSILDKFDALTNSITEGLPHEIKLRKKQYEYYRDLLLDFQKAA